MGNFLGDTEQVLNHLIECVDKIKLLLPILVTVFKKTISIIMKYLLGKRYAVKAGDTLWSIAERHYGTGANYRVILEANREEIKNEDVIHEGQILQIPFRW